jgi:hypothetical protein
VVEERRGLTDEQIMNGQEFHYGTCSVTYGPRGGVKADVLRARRNGRTQTWKRHPIPEKYRIPVKYGFKEYSNITEWDGTKRHIWHVPSECPVRTLCTYGKPHQCFKSNEHDQN